MEAVQTPTRSEQKLAQENLEALEKIARKHQGTSHAIEIEISGEKTHITVPSSALSLLNTIFEHMAEGKAISIIPSETEISTQQAAEMLNVSRPHIVKLLEEGKIPFKKVGSHRRIKVRDLQKYKDKMEEDRREQLKKLAEQAQELDMGY